MNGKIADTPFKQDFTMLGGAMAQLPVFLTVAQRRSFTAAARALGMSPSAASQAVARLEQELGVPLLVRTTRSVSLTDAGARLLSEAGPAIATASAALSALLKGRDEPTGTLRLTVPRVACHTGLPPVLMAYARRYPQVRTEVIVDDHFLDIVREGFDAGVRPKQSVHKDMIRVRLSPPLRMVVVGSKQYFARHGRPKHPRELCDHTCLTWRRLDGSGEYRWQFSERGRPFEVAVNGPLVCNDIELFLTSAEHGLGFAFVSEPEARRAIASGRLEMVLDDYSVEIEGLFLYFPRAARDVPKLRAFVACAREIAGSTTSR